MGKLRAVAVGIAAAAVLAGSAPTASADPGDVVHTTARQAITDLPVADENRDGYTRDKFKLWLDEDHDGCNTRHEVLISEAVIAPQVAPRCRLTGGSWYSWYDGETWTDPNDLDIDHVVPLAEAWDSGASTWTAGERNAYANDLGDERALAAVTDNVNQAKADKDPAEWLPDLARCRYVTDWTVVKTRWGLSVDPREAAALKQLAAGCPNEELTVALAR
ncbi:HNH endonuclease family protein [Streptomyces sp. LZ34]